ncbi:hypothetical protein DXG01_000341 [Tephrocybe rancida]|nr:hypothetical protein DXG01_000341 [Tephrocybe rancida]
MLSPTSSSSSLDSVFDRPNSRSSTPSSLASSPSSHNDNACGSTAPTFYVCINSMAIEPDVVAAAFEAYAREGCVGLCVPHDLSAQSIPPFKDWDKKDLKLGGRGRTGKVLVSCPSQYRLEQRDMDTSTPITTLPRVAQHLITFSLAGLRPVTSTPIIGGYVVYTLERPIFVYTPLLQTPGFTLSSKPSSGNIPTLDEWKTVWATWDLITLQMIPHEMLHQKPIDLRHKCLFYIGHIPTFLDMLLNKAIGGGASEPQYFWNIFENHSEVPEKDEDWPVLETIISFRNNVRARLAQLYNDLQTGKRRLTRTIARTLVMTLEHEGFHIERAGTGTLPPPGFAAPPWEMLTLQWDATPPPPTPTVVLGPATVSLGHDDSEGDDALEGVAEDVDNHVFGWDNESPERKFEVSAFRVDWRPVSNCEYEAFWREKGADTSRLPGSWVYEDGVIKVRTMYGPVSMEIAQHWPVLTSYNDLQEYACSKGGRLPTEIELQLFLDMYEVGHAGGSNTGLRNWHPIPATTGLERTNGKGSNGGVWEWTSTLFDTHEGLSPTNLFTGNTMLCWERLTRLFPG